MPDQEPQRHGEGAELASFGEELRREREIRGISLKEISDSTKISKRFLDAIERNDHRLLPAPVFTRGFVREYARYVGLNADEMVTRYNHAAANDDRIEKPPPIERYPQTPVRDISPKPPPKRGIPAGFAGIDRNAIAAVVLVLALSAVAWWAITQRRMTVDDSSDTAPEVAVTTRADVPSPLVPPPAQDGQALRLAIEVVDDAWVTLEADGRTVVNAELRRGERRTYEANEAFRFRTIGNAAGVMVTLNGTRLPALGEQGEVIKNLIFDRESLAAIQSEAKPARPNR